MQTQGSLGSRDPPTPPRPIHHSPVLGSSPSGQALLHTPSFLLQEQHLISHLVRGGSK